MNQTRHPVETAQRGFTLIELVIVLLVMGIMAAVAAPNYPALLVDGDLVIRITDADLSETTEATNFNPVGTPYQGSTDSDLSDTYPSAIAGIIYCSDDLIIDGNNKSDAARIDGVLICGDDCLLEKDARPSIEYDDAYSLSPPPGFGALVPAEAIVPGTWRQTPMD